MPVVNPSGSWAWALALLEAGCHTLVPTGDRPLRHGRADRRVRLAGGNSDRGVRGDTAITCNAGIGDRRFGRPIRGVLGDG